MKMKTSDNLGLWAHQVIANSTEAEGRVRVGMWTGCSVLQLRDDHGWEAGVVRWEE